MAQLGLNLPLLITQIVTFVILLVLLRLFAYKPIMRMMDERSKRIRESMDAADAAKQASLHAEEEAKKRLDEASREGQERIERAAKAGEDLKQKAQADARREWDALIGRARVEIQRERDDAVNGVRKEFADLTVLAAGKVIERSLDKEQHRELIEKVLQEGEKKQG